MLKKSTAPKSDNVSIATNARPAIIAGLAEGIIILNRVFGLKKPKFFLILSNCLIGNKNDDVVKMYT